MALWGNNDNVSALGESGAGVVSLDYDSLTILPDTQFVDKYNIEGSTNYSYYIVCKNNVRKSSKSNTITSK